MRRRGRRVRSRWWPRSPLPAVDCARSRRRTARRPSGAGLRRSRPDQNFCARSRPRSMWPCRPSHRHTRVGEDPLNEREDAARSPKKRSAAVAILDAGRMRFEHEATPIGVDERMALASVDLLTRIVTAWPAGLGGLDALAVDDRGRGAGVTTDPFAICHHQCVVYPFKAPVVAPGGEPAVDCPHGGKSFGSRRHGHPARVT